MDKERENDLLARACEELAEQNSMLQQELELLRAQLRRHPTGERQISEARRQLEDMRDTTRHREPQPHRGYVQSMAY